MFVVKERKDKTYVQCTLDLYHSNVIRIGSFERTVENWNSTGLIDHIVMGDFRKEHNIDNNDISDIFINFNFNL